MGESATFSENDWIVHANYGIGQIQGTEVKTISGDATHYYRVEASNSTFWIPVDQIESDIMRPLSTQEEMSQAVAALQNPPKELSSNLATRQKRIKNAKERNTPGAIARIVRDLKAYAKLKGGLNQTESTAFRTLRERLVEEWAIVMGRDTDEVASRLDTILNQDKVHEN